MRAALAVGLTAMLYAVFLALRGTGAVGTAARVPQVWARLALPLVGLRFRQIGSPMQGPGALVANHAGWLDILSILRATPVSFVAKAEVGGWPVIGAIGRTIGTVYIERRAREAGQQTGALRDKVRSGDRLCIFAEGTSTDGRRVLAFNSTLFGIFFDAGRPLPVHVQPVSLFYRAPDGLPVSFYGWWGTMDFATSLADVLARSSGGEVIVRFGAPLDVTMFTDRKDLCRAVQTEVAAGFAALMETDSG